MKHTSSVLLLFPLALLSATLAAQSITVLSGGGDASACSFTAKMAEIAHPSRGDLDACNRALDQVQLTRLDRAATYINRGIVQTALGRYQDALNDYNEALVLQPEIPQAFVGKGNLYYLAERYDEAIDSYNKALELNLPEQHAAHYNLGLTYEKLGDPAAAERSYRAALAFMPDWKPAQDKLKRLLEQ